MTLNRSHYLMGVPIFVGAVIALLSPLDVLQYEVFRAIHELASAIVPAVRKMKGDYELGQVAMLYQSATWLMSPMTVAGAYIACSQQAGAFVSHWKKMKAFSLFFFSAIVPPCVLFLAVVSLESSNPDDWRAMLACRTRTGMPIMGYVASNGAALIIGLSMVFWRNLNSIFSK